MRVGIALCQYTIATATTSGEWREASGAYYGMMIRTLSIIAFDTATEMLLLALDGANVGDRLAQAVR